MTGPLGSSATIAQQLAWNYQYARPAFPVRQLDSGEELRSVDGTSVVAARVTVDDGVGLTLKVQAPS